MSICEHCEKDMLEVDSCVKVTFERKGGKVSPLIFGEDGREDFADKEGRCGDCSIKLGGYHHPGCDVEICPICKTQAISCDCEEGVDE